MVIYNPKDWIKLIFQLHRSDTLRVLFPSILILALLSAGIVYAEKYLWDLHLRDTNILHTILGFVLSMILVFRVNSAYDRWWEGRKLWGDFVNHSRNLAIKLNSFIHEGDINNRKLLGALISNYCLSAKQHLRGEWIEFEFVKIESLHYDSDIEKKLQAASHKPNFFAAELLKVVEKMKNEKKLSESQIWLLNHEMSGLTNSIGGCERIKNTPIPYSYSLFLKKIIFAYVFSMPFCFALQFGYWTIGIAVVVFYAFASIELIAEEIEDPFGKDDNDLPIDEICDKIKKQVHEILLPLQ